MQAVQRAVVTGPQGDSRSTFGATKLKSAEKITLIYLQRGWNEGLKARLCSAVMRMAAGGDVVGGLD